MEVPTRAWRRVVGDQECRLAELRSAPGMDSLALDGNTLVASGEEEAIARLRETVERLLQEAAEMREEGVPLGCAEDAELAAVIAGRLERAFDAEVSAQHIGVPSVKICARPAELAKLKRAALDAVAGASRWGTQVIRLARDWPEYEHEVLSLLKNGGAGGLSQVEEAHGVLVQLLEGRGARICVLSDEGGERAMAQVLRRVEAEISELLDAQVISYEVPDAASADAQVLALIADCAHVDVLLDGTAPPCLRGHPSAVKQAQWALKKSGGRPHVDCLPLRSAHAPKGKDHKLLASKLQQAQRKYPATVAEMVPAAIQRRPVNGAEGQPRREPPRTHRLWLFGEDEASLLASRTDIVAGLDFLFPTEYAQVGVGDSIKWVEDGGKRLRDLQANTGVTAIVDRRRAALMLCGSGEEVTAAVQSVTQSEGTAKKVSAAVQHAPASELKTPEAEAAPAHPKESPQAEALALNPPSAQSESAVATLGAGEGEASAHEPPSVELQARELASVEEAAGTPKEDPAPAEAAPPLQAPERTAASAPAAAEPTLTVASQDAGESDVTTAVWYYLDDDGACQGPFQPQEMSEWYHYGYLPNDLRIWSSPVGVPPPPPESFCPLGDVVEVMGGF